MIITGLILAGGRGSRMGHVDKGLQPFRNKPMVAHVITRLAPQVHAMIINANQNRTDYAAFGLPVWPDAMPDFAGPLAGLQTGLMHCTTTHLVTAPCDSPFLPTDLVLRLKQGLLDADADVAVAVTGEGASRQPHPVFCLLNVSLLDSLTAYLHSGARKIDTWFTSLDAVDVHFPDEAAFSNINTLDELRKFEAG